MAGPFFSWIFKEINVSSVNNMCEDTEPNEFREPKSFSYTNGGQWSLGLLGLHFRKIILVAE